MINNKLSFRVKKEHNSMDRLRTFSRLAILGTAVSILGGCAMSSMFTPYPDQAESFKQAPQSHSDTLLRCHLFNPQQPLWTQTLYSKHLIPSKLRR